MIFNQPETAKRKLAVCCGLGMALNPAIRVCARVQIPVCPEPPLVFSHELLGGFVVVSVLRFACVFLDVERGRSSKRVWRSHRKFHLLICLGHTVLMFVFA
jgi:hypothetical protein